MTEAKLRHLQVATFAKEWQAPHFIRIKSLVNTYLGRTDE